MSFYGKLTRHVASFFFQSGEAHKDGGTKQKMKDTNKKLRIQTKSGGVKQKVEAPNKKMKDPNKKLRIQTKSGGATPKIRIQTKN